MSDVKRENLSRVVIAAIRCAVYESLPDDQSVREHTIRAIEDMCHECDIPIHGKVILDHPGISDQAWDIAEIALQILSGIPSDYSVRGRVKRLAQLVECA